MSPAANFFVCACTILVFTIINLSLGPCINSTVKNLAKESWALNNCAKEEDDYESAKERNPNMSDDDKEEYEKSIRECKNKKTMHNMEYTSCIFNVVISFICILLGIHGLQKELIPKTGMIGMGCGVVGFILTFVYVIYNGVVSTNYYPDAYYKTDGKGAFAEFDGNKYKCFYFKKKGDTDALYAKYADLVKSQYNYNKDLDDSFEKDKIKKGCKYNSIIGNCANAEYITNIASYTYEDGGTEKQCPYLYYHNNKYDDYENRDIGSRFLTLLILSIFILLCYCGLIFSGFMIMKESS